nr:hypothetical protein [Pirellulales bacterium]
GSRARGASLLAEADLLRPLLPELALHAVADDQAWRAAIGRLGRLEHSTVPLAFAALLHGMVDLEQVRVLARRLRLSNKELDRTMWLLQQLPAMLDAATLPWPRLQRLLVHEGSHELLALAAVILPAGDAGMARCREQLARPADQWNPPPLVTGDALMRRGVKPGRQFAALLEHLRDEQLEGRIRTQDEAVAAARVWLENAGNVGER